MKDSPFMLEALNQAKIAFEQDEVPIGAVIVENNQIIAKAYNQNRFFNDPTAHAEILAIRKACEIKKNSRLENCEIYITIEPCLMCSTALSFSKIKTIYYGASEKKFGAIESNVKAFSFHRPQIYSGICELDSADLMTSFFKKKR
jgi:tRNA(Arg) A34 adenosine deaminase TadA